MKVYRIGFAFCNLFRILCSASTVGVHGHVFGGMGSQYMGMIAQYAVKLPPMLISCSVCTST